MIRKNWLCFLCLWLLFKPLLVGEDFSRFTVAAQKIQTPPQLDGILDDEVWKNVPVLTDFIQFEPHKGEPASVRTEVRILYDDNNLYVGFLCFDPEPEKVVLGTRRDRLLMGVDSACITVDTFHDKRAAYYFRTNPLGVQHDGRVSDNGRVADVNWDGVWESAGATVPEGWSAEIAIPFSTVKFKPGENQTWGLQTSRYFPRNLEKSFWTGPLEDYRKMDGNGTLTGLDLQASQHRPIFIPYAMSGLQQGADTEWRLGMDARYNFTSAISGHLTINPDFATVEADVEKINLTRFELNLPEKRNFFLEGNHVFQQRIRLFYSRRIADIYGGAKVYGKSGKNEFTALSVQAKEEEEGAGSANFSIFRWRRDIMQSSSLGFIMANKHLNGQNQGTVGLDTALYFSPTFKFTGQLAGSYGHNRQDMAFFLRPSYDSSTFHIHLRYTYLGKYFGDNANAVGYIRDDNRHELDSAITKTFWMETTSLDRIAYRSNYNIFWGMDKVLRSWDVWQNLTFDLRNKLSFSVRHDQEYKLYEKEFRNHGTRLGMGYNTREWESARLSYEFGKNFDSDYELWQGGLQKKLSQDLSLEYSLTWLTKEPDPDNQSTWIHTLRVTQYFTPDLYFKVFFQTNSSIDKQNIQVVCVYRYQPPFGLIQLAYQKGTATFGEKGDQGHTLFIKWAYMFD